MILQINEESTQGKSYIYIIYFLYREKIVLNNMIFEKNLPTFRKKMNHLQSESVLKKSPEEKRGMFLEKKRLEEEQRKKEEEEKKLSKQ